MSQPATLDYARADYEFRWFAAVGMIAFLIAAACGSFIVMAAGLLMWGGFSMLARRLLSQSPTLHGASRPLAPYPRPGHFGPVGQRSTAREARTASECRLEERLRDA